MVFVWLCGVLVCLGFLKTFFLAAKLIGPFPGGQFFKNVDFFAEHPINNKMYIGKLFNPLSVFKNCTLCVWKNSYLMIILTQNAQVTDWTYTPILKTVYFQLQTFDHVFGLSQNCATVAMISRRGEEILRKLVGQLIMHNTIM